MTYVKDPKMIENTSMEIIADLVPEIKEMDQKAANVVKRVIHTTGDPEIISLIKYSDDAIIKGIEAIRQGKHVVTDVNMLKAGVSQKTLDKFGGQVFCHIGEEDVAQAAKAKGITRAMAGIEKAIEQIDGGIVAIGNAPTALFYLLELIEQGRCKPALIVGTPVGFVGARESKDLLITKDVDYVTVLGNRGGSTIAASIVNALLYMA